MKNLTEILGEIKFFSDGSHFLLSLSIDDVTVAIVTQHLLGQFSLHLVCLAL
jgi:hypothetical protein